MSAPAAKRLGRWAQASALALLAASVLTATSSDSATKKKRRHRAHPAASAAPSTVPSALAAPLPSSAFAAPPSSASSSTEPAAPPPAAPLHACGATLLSEPVRDAAVGERRLALLAREPWLFDGGRGRAIPLPPKFRAAEGETESVRIFFGRDDWPRLIGRRQRGTDAPKSVYLRWRPSRGWHLAPEELGRLGRTKGDLFGVLGHADPEVVCRSADTCVIKRRIGWREVAALPGPLLMRLTRGQVFAFDDKRTLQLGAAGFGLRIEHAALGRMEDAALDEGRHLWLADAESGAVYTPMDAGVQLRARFDGARALVHFDGRLWVGGRAGLAQLSSDGVIRPVVLPSPLTALSGLERHEPAQPAFTHALPNRPLIGYGAQGAVRIDRFADSAEGCEPAPRPARRKRR